jgi:F0F1-type ATP synthase membrane subunit b/b'
MLLAVLMLILKYFLFKNILKFFNINIQNILKNHHQLESIR